MSGLPPSFPPGLPGMMPPGAAADPALPPGPDPVITAGADQPLEVRLDPKINQAFHGKILGRLTARLHMSQRVIQRRYDDWDQVNDTLRMFVDLSRKAKKGDGQTNQNKKEMPFDRAIVIPASFAIHDLRKSQLLGIFSSRKPMTEVDGRGPEDVVPAKRIEAMLDYDADQTGALSVVHTLVQDADRYGVGIVHDVWEEEPGFVTKHPEPMNPILEMLAKAIAPSTREPQRVPGIVREFNKWTSVDPYNWWPDPRKPVSDLQSGEFCGHRTFEGRLSLLERSAQRGGPFFNIEKLKDYAGKGTRNRTDAQRRSRFSTEDFVFKEAGAEEKDEGFYAIDHLQVKLIPREWELAEGTDPEIWWFAIADESLIIRAHPSAYQHGKFNYSAGEILPDPHETLNPGMVEQMDGLQRVINWLYNSRIENIRRSLNNSLIWSPLFFEEADMLHPNPAGSVRLTQKAEELILSGIPIGHLWQQLAVQDVTGPHMQMTASLFDMAQRMSAVSDPALSQPTDDKRTLGEVSAILSAGSQRVRIIAQLIDAAALAPLANRAIANRQQFTSLEQYFKVTGDLAKMEETGGMDRLLINRDQVQGNFDYVPNSGILPADPARQAELWIKMLEIAAKVPQVSTPGPDGRLLDLRAVFNEAVLAAGIKNISSFYMDALPPQVIPDQQLQAGIQAGNVVPLNAVQG